MDQEETTLTQEKIISEPIALSHPWFQANTALVQQVRAQLEANDVKQINAFIKSFGEEYHQSIYNSKTPEELAKEFDDSGIVFSTPCGKSIEPNEYFYRCLDCDKFRNMDSSFITVICKYCFEKSNHEGHRVFMSLKNNTSTGICDCGDPECLEVEGFCADHQYVKNNPEEILEKFPPRLKKIVLEKLQESLYGLSVCLKYLSNRKIHTT